MKTLPLCGVALLASLLGGSALLAADPAPAAATLPAETVALRTSPLPGFTLATRRCGVCHSSDYIAYQPPALTLTQWTAEVTKMRTTYGAPIDADETRLIGIYLAASYGDASSVPADALAARAAPPAADAPDAQALLASRGCLGCHALQQKIVGPAYRDVAQRYRTDPQAIQRLTGSIRQGGAGRWGEVAMPPFADLDEKQAQALAAFVMQQ